MKTLYIKLLINYIRYYPVFQILSILIVTIIGNKCCIGTVYCAEPEKVNTEYIPSKEFLALHEKYMSTAETTYILIKQDTGKTELAYPYREWPHMMEWNFTDNTVELCDISPYTPTNTSPSNLAQKMSVSPESNVNENVVIPTMQAIINPEQILQDVMDNIIDKSVDAINNAIDYHGANYVKDPLTFGRIIFNVLNTDENRELWICKNVADLQNTENISIQICNIICGGLQESTINWTPYQRTLYKHIAANLSFINSSEMQLPAFARTPPLYDASYLIILHRYNQL